jgi:hypothetical protein
LFRQSPPERLDALPAACLLTLARLLCAAGRTEDALEAYRRLLERYPGHIDRADIALEAGRYAAAKNRPADAQSFLDHAPAGRAEVEDTVAAAGAPPAPTPQAAAQDVPTLVPREAAPAAPLPPRRSVGALLAGFMEERNILWGELVGGLLIVGGSIALVISLWNRLQDQPYFPFGIFAAVTAALFGAGLYTLHHWKLESTSRGLLVIATLLVPLNFTVLPSMLEEAAGDRLELLIAAGGLVVFTLFLYQAGRVLVPEGGWLLALAVLGCSASQLLAARLLLPGVAQPGPGWLLLLAGVPVACYSLSLGRTVQQLGRAEALPERGAWSLLALLGLGAFAVAMALGVLLFRSTDFGVALRHLALPAAVAAVPILAGGLLLHRGLEQAPGLAGLRATGTAVALSAVAVMLVAVGLAWPQPGMVLAVCALNFVVLTLAAFRGRLPVAHAAALPCAALGYLVAIRLHEVYDAQQAGWFLGRLFAAPAGLWLTVLMVALAGTGEVLARLGQRVHALAYTVGAGAVALLSLVLVTWHGLADPTSLTGHASLTYGATAAVFLAINLRWCRPWVSYVGLALACCTTLWALHWGWADELTTSGLWATSLLLDASLLLSAALLVGAVWREGEFATTLRRVYAEPQTLAALVCSFVALLPLLLDERSLEARSLCMGWLAAVWLALSWTQVSRWLFACFQIALCVTVGLAVTAWLEGQPWVMENPEAGFWDPRSLQMYGLALAGLCLAWVAARIALRANRTAQHLLLPDWPGVDRLVIGALVLGQMGLADWGILYGVLQELTPASMTFPREHWPPEHIFAYAAGAWPLFGALVLTMLAGLWQPAPGRRQTEALLGLAVLAVTAPTLWAGRFVPERAAASGLRWGLAVAFLAGSALLWLRGPLASLAAGLRMPSALPGSAARVRRSLLDLALLPVLLLTGAVAVLAFRGTPPRGPLADSVFSDMGATLSVMVPLGLLSLALVGHALRERSAGYAFAAGLLVNVIVTGGHALAVVTAGGVLGTAEWVRLLQLGTITAALWALLWLTGRSWLGAWREETDRPLARRLMLVQVGMAVAGNVGLILTAVCALTGSSLNPDGLVDRAWTTEAGSLFGWLALALTASAVYGRRGWSLPAADLGTLGLAVVALLACTVERLFPGWGYRSLMTGWAGYGLAWALLCWRLPVGRITAAAPFWVGHCGLLVVALGLGAAVAQDDYLWSAGAISTASAAGCLVAARQRRGAWALTAGLGFNLAASLVVWHIQAGLPLSLWLVPLVQVNGVVSAGVALAWLRVRPWLYTPADLTWSVRSTLTAQVVLALLPSFALLLVAFLAIYWSPAGPMPLHVLQAGEAAGWLALALAAIAALWLARRAAFAGVAHVLGACGLLFVVLLAATAAAWDDRTWLAYHALLAALVALAAALLGAGWAGSGWRERVGPLLGELLPARATQRWVEGLGAVLAGLALRAAVADPGAPYWPAGTILAVSLLAGGLAFWSGRLHYVHLSGCLVLVAGVLAWAAWGEGQRDSFLCACIICLGIAAAVWSVLEARLRLRPHVQQSNAGAWSAGSVGVLLVAILLIILVGPRALSSRLLTGEGGQVLTRLVLPITLLIALPLLHVLHVSKRTARAMEEALVQDAARGVPFSQAAGLLGLSLLAILVGVGLCGDLAEAALQLAGPLAWTAWAITLLAGAVRLWDAQGLRNQRTLPLYVVGLLGLGLGLHGLALRPADLGWRLALTLACYILVTTLAGWASTRLSRLWQALRLPAHLGEAWFWPVQAGVTSLVVLLSVWISFAFADRLDRLAGPLAVALMLPAWALGTRLGERDAFSGTWSPAALRYGTLLLGVVCAANLAWALPSPAEAGAWLHRNVLLFAALALTAAGYGLGLRRLLPGHAAWADHGERLGPPLGLTAVLVVLVVLGQELVLFDPATKMAPMAPWAVALMALTLLGLAAAAICFAVLPHADPLALPEGRRPWYVYASELVLVLLFLHSRLTMPFLFGGVLAQYWTLVVMVLAFVGVGLAELVERRGLRVLAEPLQRTGVFLPVLPLLAFWLPVLAEPLYHGPGQEIRGLQPFLDAVRKLPPHFDRYAVLWLLVGLLYSALAVARRSVRFALLAALACNFGLWALMYHYRAYGVSFFAHPQLWLIPLALILLVAEYLNRDRLPEAQATALRYFALIMLYLSSTADLFIAGLGDVGLSLVLAVLAVLGVLAGIQLRVRAFLFLGVGFLVLVIGARIWHAAVTQAQTWVWWVALIVLGAAILTLFAVFEKRRNDVLRMLEELKRWR